MKKLKHSIQKYFEEIKEKHRFVAITVDFKNRLFADRVWAMGSHVAMASLFALFPFLICVTSVIGFFNFPNDLDSLVKELLQNLPEEVSAPIENEIHSILTMPRTGLFTIGFVFVVLFASNGVEALRAALNQAYNDKDKDSRSFIVRRLQSLLLVIFGVAGALMFSGLFIVGPTVWTILIEYFPILEDISTLINYGGLGVTLVTLVTFLIICHVILPNGKRPLVDLLPGIGLTLMLWIVGGVMVAEYFEKLFYLFFYLRRTGWDNVSFAISISKCICVYFRW